MGITKNHIYTERQIELARLFKALSHPARIAVIDNLLTHENLNCNDLRSFIPLAQSTISGHLKVLFDVGVLAVSVIGSNAYYEINKIALEPMTDYLEQVLSRQA
jgi:ArsR family transcriptional regulator